jgi:hypothetical protein
MDNTYSFADLCRALGKSGFYIYNLQRALGIPVMRDGGHYSAAYLRFMEKAVSLRAFSVSNDKIQELFELEKKILRLLHIDSLSQSETWYLEGCNGFPYSEKCLLLTGFDLGFPLTADGSGHVQHHLDFSERDPELFSGAEMGEDVRIVLEKYTRLVTDVRERVEQETPVLRDALAWAGEVFPRGPLPRRRGKREDGD